MLSYFNGKLYFSSYCLFDLHFNATIQRKTFNFFIFCNEVFFGSFKDIFKWKLPSIINLDLIYLKSLPPPLIYGWSPDLPHSACFLLLPSLLKNVLLLQHLALISLPFVAQFQVWSRSFWWWASPSLYNIKPKYKTTQRHLAQYID